MYGLDQLWRGIKEPYLAISEANKQISRLKNGVDYNPSGVDIFDEDWDNLILLDACRYDKFEQITQLPGQLEHRVSRGSTSPEFIRGNFRDKTLNDVVYVSANRFYAKLRDEVNASVHQFIPVALDAPDVASSLPSTVTNEAIDAIKEHPNKRLIIHYLQPHQPYFAPACSHISNESEIHKTIQANDLSEEEVIEAYEENLRFVLAEVDRLFEHMQGKTVVSADHGELLGERQYPIPFSDYGHPEGVYTEELVKVPWYIYENPPRKDIVAEAPRDRLDLSADVDKALRHLGYRV